MNEKCRKLNPTCRKKSVISLIKWPSFPCTARPEALALAITLFQLMVAGLSSSGFGSITKITTPAVSLHLAIEALAVLANS